MSASRRWFDRKFELGLRAEEAPALFERLRGTADRLDAVARELPTVLLGYCPEGRWSIKENIGHLTDLEAVWEQRLDDFDRGAAVLAAADLDNRKTHDAAHNARPVYELLREFRSARERILARLAVMDGTALARVGKHPRLQQDMSVVDLCYFVAEHDDHHLRTIEDIAQTLPAFPDYALDLLNVVERAAPALLAFDDETARRRPSPGKWSPKEIIGHLVDSASNNHQRFVRAVFQDDLIFTGYDQTHWVSVQHYQDAQWPELVTLWASFNRHLAHVMVSIPQTARRHRHARHNLHQLAWQPVEEHVPASLDYLMDDYVAHLRHHLRQISAIIPAFEAPPPA
jgi:hypothetical protein